MVIANTRSPFAGGPIGDQFPPADQFPLLCTFHTRSAPRAWRGKTVSVRTHNPMMHGGTRRTASHSGSVES
jgi:hypothetical protein